MHIPISSSLFHILIHCPHVAINSQNHRTSAKRWMFTKLWTVYVFINSLDDFNFVFILIFREWKLTEAIECFINAQYKLSTHHTRRERKKESEWMQYYCYLLMHFNDCMEHKLMIPKTNYRRASIFIKFLKKKKHNFADQ